MFDSYDNLPLFHWLFLVYLTFMIFEFGAILNNQIKFHIVSQSWDSSLLWSCNNQQEQ